MTMRLLIEPIVRAALLEDLGRAGDITSEAVVPAEATVEAIIAARQSGILAGLDAALLAFELLDPLLRIERRRADLRRDARDRNLFRVKLAPAIGKDVTHLGRAVDKCLVRPAAAAEHSSCRSRRALGQGLEPRR